MTMTERSRSAERMLGPDKGIAETARYERDRRHKGDDNDRTDKKNKRQRAKNLEAIDKIANKGTKKRQLTSPKSDAGRRNHEKKGPRQI